MSAEEKAHSIPLGDESEKFPLYLGRQLVGASHEGLLPVAAMLGGMLVVIADLLGRVLFAPLELPCGIITAAIGAPYFVYLLINHRK